MILGILVATRTNSLLAVAMVVLCAGAALNNIASAMMLWPEREPLSFPAHRSSSMSM